ncbi:MAG TPA: LysE family transporter [Candidatus Paceibacterota bacterium]
MNSIFLAQLLTVAVVHLFAVMSPGPDFAVVTRNSLIYSRKIGIYTSVGIALGIMVHVGYSLLGIGFLIAKSIVLFNIIKFVGAGYLIYIGYMSLKAKPKVQSGELAAVSLQTITPWQSIKVGFLTNALNPKATLFFLALFTQVINPATPKLIQFIYGIEMMVITFVWFSVLSLVFSNSMIRKRITGVQHYVERITGVVLIALGIKVALATQK